MEKIYDVIFLIKHMSFILPYFDILNNFENPKTNFLKNLNFRKVEIEWRI